MKLLNPKNITRPASNYSQGVVVPANARRLIISGQIGIDPDGSIAHPDLLVEIEGEAVSGE